MRLPPPSSKDSAQPLVTRLPAILPQAMTSTDFKRFLNIDGQLVRAGFHPTPLWWLDEIERFYDHPTALSHVANVGRGGIKSGVGTRFGLSEVLSGKFTVPKGERHYFAFVSVNRDEAAQRLRLLESYLQTLGLGYSRASDTINLDTLPLGFKVFSASVSSVSGFRCVGAFCDELAKWRSGDDAANPADDVDASLKAMMVTHATVARRLYFSSPVWVGDYHSQLVAKGDTRDQIVSSAPTWIANPSVTEAQTRQLEPDERVWRREYLAQAQAAASAAFPEPDIVRSFEPRGDVLKDHARVLVVDVASGGRSSGDRFTWGFCGWSETLSGPVLMFDSLHCFESADLRAMGGDAVIAHVAAHAKERGVHPAFGDQREDMMVKAAFRRNGVHFTPLPWTATAKPRAVARVRRWLIDGLLCLPKHDKLLGELRSFEERFTSSGDLTYGARGARGHDDFVALLITAAIADEERKLRGSAFTRREHNRGAALGRSEMRAQYEAVDAVSAGALDRLRVEGTSVVIGPPALRRLTMRGGNGFGGTGGF